MKQGIFEITENTRIARDVYRMKLSGDASGITRPGQFVNVRLDGLFLRRPISVFDRETDALTLIYKTVGQGTAQMSRMIPGETLHLLTGLGNGYDLSRAGDHPLLIGGGVGVPPLYGLAKALRQAGKAVTAVLGFNTGEDVFAEADFQALGCETVIATADGSRGIRGFVTDALPSACSYYYACGPLPMLRPVFRTVASEGSSAWRSVWAAASAPAWPAACRPGTAQSAFAGRGRFFERRSCCGTPDCQSLRCGAG